MPSFGCVFPGQGSQTVGMLSDIAEDYPEIIDTYSKASNVLGYDLWKLVLEGPQEKLDQTIHTQPALLTGSYAIWRVVQNNQTFSPTLMAGHSLGEYTALVCSGAISFEDALGLVVARGHFMQEAVPLGQGALAVIIGLNAVQVAQICENALQENEVLAPANFNGPKQIVIAGHAASILQAMTLAKEAGARLVKLLPVSVPSHCILMQPAAEKLKSALDKIPIATPLVPVLSNVDVKIYQNSDEVRDGLVRQLFQPVRWVEIIQMFVQKGVTQIIECGPGSILTGLNKRIMGEIQLTHTADLGSLRVLLHTLRQNA